MVSRDKAGQPLTPTVFHVLLSLRDGPIHGYAVMKRVEDDSGISMGPGTVYGALQRLVDAEWVTEEQAAGDDVRRGRVFSMTPAGRAALSGEAERITRLAESAAVRRLLPDGPRP